MIPHNFLLLIIFLSVLTLKWRGEEERSFVRNDRDGSNGMKMDDDAYASLLIIIFAS